MNKSAIYIHGKGGNIDEALHYKPLFKAYDVIGFDYKSDNPWDARKEFKEYFDEINKNYEEIIIIASSIGAYFTMCSLNEYDISRAYFISPVVDMKKLIEDMMMWADVSIEELKMQKRIETSFNETLDYDYYCYVKDNPVIWDKETYILYGDSDNLTSLDTINTFVKETDSQLTIMKDGEHWFHTPEQLKFLDEWNNSTLLSLKGRL